MQPLNVIYKRPEDVINEIMDKQQTVRTSRLKVIVAPLSDKLKWQGKTIKNNVATINKLNRRTQLAEEKIKRKNKAIEKSSETIRTMSERLQKVESKLEWINDAQEKKCNILHNRAQRAENQLEIARREIVGLKMDARIAQSSQK